MVTQKKYGKEIFSLRSSSWESINKAMLVGVSVGFGFLKIVNLNLKI
jgi:hypothetical protein